MHILPFVDSQAVTNSRFGKPKKPVHLNNVHCNGGEEGILSCTHTDLDSLDEKKKALSEVDVAGVICQTRSSSGPIATSAPNNGPGNPTTSTSGGETTDEVLSESSSSVIPNYLIAFVLAVGLVLAAVIAMM